MFPRIVTFAVVFWLNACACGMEPPGKLSAIDAWPALAAAAESGASERVLLLRDGRVFMGAISPGKDFYKVKVASGQLQVPANEVDSLCSDLQEAYSVRRRRVPANQGSAHLELAKWCLRNRLYQQAALELNEAQRLEPQLAELPVMRRRLEWATERQTPDTTSEEPIEDSQPDVGTTEPTSDVEAAPAESIPRDADLERLVRGLSADVTLDFKTYIQPLLVNHCATAACHGVTAENRPRLVRLNRHRQVPRRITLRNMEETLAFVDRSNPNDSLLLSKAIEPHGGLTTGILDRNQAGYRQLAHWARRASGASNRRPLPNVAHSAAPTYIAPATANLPLQHEEVQLPTEGPQPVDRKSKPARLRQTPSIPWVRDLVDEESEIGTADHEAVESDLDAEILADLENDPFLFDPPTTADELLGPTKKNGGTFTPVDQFDPELFNRRFLPESGEATAMPEADLNESELEPLPDATDSGDFPR
ncbi:MAG: hypothetical protein AB7U73_07285 [Pirellulales bacterium]